MNQFFIFLYSILLYGLVSCSGVTRSVEMEKSFEITDTCKLDSKNSYEVFIPERKTDAGKLPMLIIIDAHGSGKFALNKFKLSANHYPAILVASNLVKNGYINYEGAIKTLIDDVRQKYQVSETVFMTGFSGGARMALGYALTHRLNGLILCGALANAKQINALQCQVISISGMDDFNFMETAQYLFQEQTIPGNLKIEVTNSSHNWPDSLMLSNALGFLQLSGRVGNESAPAKSKIELYCQFQQARIDTLVKQGDFLKAALIARNMSTTTPFNTDKNFATSFNNMKTNKEYISQLSRLKNYLNIEINARQPYIDAFTAKDSIWWENEIITIDEKIKSEKDAYKVDMYRRIKGFWGIACYSFGNQAVQEKDVEIMKKIVPIYRMLEPENPYVYYLSAFPFYWNGNNDATISMLKKAWEEGFSEMNLLKKDFPESITSKLN